MSGAGGRVAPRALARMAAAAALILFALSLGAAAQDAPPAPPAPTAPQAPPKLRHPGDPKPVPPRVPDVVHGKDFPDLKPFARSRFWKSLADHVRRSGLTDDAVAGLEQELTVIRMQHGLAMSEAGGINLDGPTDQLGTRLTEDQRLWLWQAPLVLAQVEPLWTTAAWSPAQLGEARAAARFFARRDGAPQVELLDGQPGENHAAFERLVEWFRAEVARPESYALMLITEDGGPWTLAEATALRSLKELAAMPLDAERRLVLRRDEKAGGPWLLQLVQGKKALWTRSMPRVPADAPLAFEGEPQSLGERGWLVRLNDGRALSLYLDGKAEPLFYFTAS